jgi:hypothetical protein
MRLTNFFFLFLLAFGCSSESNPITQQETNQPVDFNLCDTCDYPVVMVHGFLASGDTWAPFQQLFTSNGYHGSRVWAFDWNSLAQGANTAVLLDAYIDKVLQKTGTTKVRLMGHSAGGGVGYTYLSDPVRASKVDAYVHIGSNPQSGPAGPGGSVPTLNIWSPDDAIVAGADIPGAENLQLSGKDHYQVATSNESFAAIYEFFHGTPPATLSVVPQNPVCIGGRVLTFGENNPQINARVDIYALDAATGNRLSSTPFETWFSDSLGNWGPTNVTPNQRYEFAVTTANASDRKVFYFREGFVHLNQLVYLRTIPPPTSLAGLLLAGLPNTSGQTVMNVFSARQAVITPRDTLRVNGTIVSTPQYANEAKTGIAYFLYDDGDNNTELTPVGLFNTFPFLNGVDYYFPTAVPATIGLQFNDRVLNVRNIPSNQGIVVGVFD